jgi:predicted outer membrane repeat protein
MQTKTPKKHEASNGPPIKASTLKANSSAFVKPSLNIKRGMAVLGTTGLVLGMGVAATSSASAATAPFACNPGNTAVADATEGGNGDVIEIQDTFNSLVPIEGVVEICLDGVFDLDWPIGVVFDEDVHFFGVGNTSIAGGYIVSDDDGEDPDPLYSITIENLSFTDMESIVAINVEVIDSSFSNSREGLMPGAISAYGTVTVIDSTFSGNDSGAIFAEGAVDVTGSTFSSNLSGAIWSFGTVTVTDSTFRNNISDSGGAIISLAEGDQTVTVSNSTFLGNMAEDGGAIYADGVFVLNSTFEDNIALGFSEEESNFGGFGGAIRAIYVEVGNSTFVGNIAGGPFSEGGAIFAEEGGVVFSTFLNNEASGPVVGEDVPGNAIYKFGGLGFAVAASIFAGVSDDPQLGVGVDEEASDKFDDWGGNVFSTSALTEVDITQDPQDINSEFGASLTELFGTETPSLATHAPNSYGTQTIALFAGSLAIDFVTDADIVGTLFDQRGATRSYPYDAGAFEFVIPTDALAKTGIDNPLWLIFSSAGLIALGASGLAFRSRFKKRKA